MQFSPLVPQSFSLFGYIPQDVKWLFYVVLFLFIVAIHIHAINRD